MGTFIKNQNLLNILNTNWASNGNKLSFNAQVKDINGTTYNACTYSGLNTFYNSSSWASYLYKVVKLGLGAPGNSRRGLTPDSTYNQISYDIGYELTAPTKDTYVTDRTNMSCSFSGTNGSTMAGTYTITNSTGSEGKINCIAAYQSLYGDTTFDPGTWGTPIFILLSTYYFDEITIPDGGSATIYLNFD